MSSLIADALFGKTRQLVLGLLFSNPDRMFYSREITRILDIGEGTVHNELATLTAVGILTREKKGKQVFYSVNRECPIYEELNGLVTKTVGLFDVVRRQLSGYVEQIVVAFIYGSFAKGSETSRSDIDLMVIGTLSFSQVAEVCSQVERKIAREVNPSVYLPEDWHTRVAAGNHFILSVLAEPKVFLVGDESVLNRLGATGLAT